MASYFLTREMAMVAFEFVRPTIDELIKQGIFKRPHFALVAIDPTVKFLAMETEQEEWERFIRKAILFFGRVGDVAEWKYPFDWIAVGKAFLSWKYGQPSRRIQAEFPYNCGKGDTVFGGSVIDEGGFITAGSGVDAEHDEMIAGMYNWFCKGSVTLLARKHREANAEENFYGGGFHDFPPGFNLSLYTGRYDGKMRCPSCDSRDIQKIPKAEAEGNKTRHCRDCKHDGTRKEFDSPK